MSHIIDDCCHEAAAENNNMPRKNNRNNSLSSSVDTSDGTSILSSGLDEKNVMNGVRVRQHKSPCQRRDSQDSILLNNHDVTPHCSEYYYSKPSHRKTLSRIIRRRTSDVDSCSSCPLLRRLSTEEMALSTNTNNIVDNSDTPRRGRRPSRTPSPSLSSKSSLQSSTRHLSNLILKSLLVTLFITSSIHYYTYTNLRYNLHYLGMYNIRGVVSFKSADRPLIIQQDSHPISRVRVHSSAKKMKSIDDDISLQQEDTQGEEDPQEYYDIPSQEISMTTHSTIPNQDSQETTTTLPLMLSRNYVARSGGTSNRSHDIPRGTPLPRPMLTLLNVNICAVAASAHDCEGVSRGGNGKLLECAWCPQTSSSATAGSANQDENEGGKCVPKDMRGVMCK